MTATVSLLARLARHAAVVTAAVLATALLGLFAAPSAEAARHRHDNVYAATERAPYVGRHLSPKRHAKAKSRTRVASLGRDDDTGSRRRPSRSVASTGHNVIWQASAGCLNGTLRGVIAQISTMATIRVSSTCRDHSHNASVGGAKKSWHLSGDAVDFRVMSGNTSAVYAYLRSNSSIGGLKHYGGGLFHADTGPRRSW